MRRHSFAACNVTDFHGLQLSTVKEATLSTDFAARSLLETKCTKYILTVLRKMQERYYYHHTAFIYYLVLQRY